MTSVGHHNGVVTRVYTPETQHKGYVTVTPSEANSLNGLVWVCKTCAPVVAPAMRLIITHESLVVMARIVACDMPVPNGTIHCGTPFSCNPEDTLSLHVDNVVYSVPGVECDIRLDNKVVLATTVVVRTKNHILNRENLFPTEVCTITLVISSNNNGLYNMCFCLSDYESALRTLRMSFLTEFADRHTLMLLMDGLVDVRTLMPDMMAAIKCDTNIRDWARKLIDNACRQGNKVSKVFMIFCRSLQPSCTISVKYASMITL
ncbi:hypothetical protein ORF 390R [Red seabream iridovirus]|uniref:Uncharacterized protein ORF 390R n=1 Tax=Red sea bream iridovirus TaxID=65424 RepID=F1SVV0_RSIV|nr:hypothetical protein ORF 390R [Red seabream iridovirus]